MQQHRQVGDVGSTQSRRTRRVFALLSQMKPLRQIPSFVLMGYIMGKIELKQHRLELIF